MALLVKAGAKLADFLQEQGRDRGLWGNSSKWMGVWVLVGGIRFLAKRFKEEPVIIREKLEPGQQLVISHFADSITVGALEGGKRRKRRS